MTPEMLRFLNGWNGKRIAFITEREVSEERRDPTFDLVARIKLQRMERAGGIMRAREEFLPRRIQLADMMWTEESGMADYLWTQEHGTKRNCLT